MINHVISSPLGVVSVYFEANVTSGRAQGFNASFWVKRCGNASLERVQAVSLECQAGAQCINGICECPHDFGGPQCDRPVCPGNCWSRGRQRHLQHGVWHSFIAASCFVLEHKKHTKMHFRYVPQFSSYMFAYTLQTLGLCVCTEGWAGSDCSSISDSDSLVWETLLDTQLSAVRLTLSPSRL